MVDNRRYELSSHLFEDCTFAQQHEEPTHPVENTTVASCDDGALHVETGGDFFKANVNDPNIVSYIEQESENAACAPDNGGCVTKRLPTEATIEGEALIIKGLTGSIDQMRFVTLYPGSRIERDEQGMKLELRGAQLANSRTEVRYEIANWFFNACRFQ